MGGGVANTSSEYIDTCYYFVLKLPSIGTAHLLWKSATQINLYLAFVVRVSHGYGTSCKITLILAYHVSAQSNNIFNL